MVIFKIIPWKSRIMDQVKFQDHTPVYHAVNSYPFRFKSIGPSSPEIQLFKNLNLNIQKFNVKVNGDVKVQGLTFRSMLITPPILEIWLFQSPRLFILMHLSGSCKVELSILWLYLSQVEVWHHQTFEELFSVTIFEGGIDHAQGVSCCRRKKLQGWY